MTDNKVLCISKAHWDDVCKKKNKEIILNAKSLFVVLTTDICTQLLNWFKVNV